MSRRVFIFLIVLFTIGFFILPFFWFHPGEMDLGGDSSRLYFYDPLSYIKSQTLYNVISSGLGGEAISYYSLPFFILIYLVKLIVVSPTIVIAFFNGIKASLSFLAVYLIIKELGSFWIEKKYVKNWITLEISAFLGGLFYLLSPNMIYAWDRAILSHNQIFLNPLFFYLVLKYFLTQNKSYSLLLLIISFLFSLNFSYISAPPFFAFYPISLLFIFLYTKFIRKKSIPWKGTFLTFILFVLLQSFHLVPHVISLFSPTNEAFVNVSSDQGKFSRGLDYFLGIAPFVKVSFSILHIRQLTTPTLFSYLSIIFPIIILFGFLRNKDRMLPCVGIIFLIVVFFYSANITNLGFSIYKWLFNVPGFSMFRNFFGQWIPTYVFYYSIILGLSLTIIQSFSSKFFRYVFIILFISITLINGWSFINGYVVNLPLWGSELKQVIKMDPVFISALKYVEYHTSDAKIFSFPVTGPGYQVFAGREGGIYAGPSTFSYLLGKSDFSGLGSLGDDFQNWFVKFVDEKDYGRLERLMGMLNVKYFFYNSDKSIYESEAVNGLYGETKKFLPKTQDGYQAFLGNFPITRELDFGRKYHLLTLNNRLYLPHIYAFSYPVYSNNPLDSSLLMYQYDDYRAPNISINAETKSDSSVILESDNENQLQYILNNIHLHRHDPFVSRRLDDWLYPLSQVREQYTLNKLKNDNDAYYNMDFLLISKRIAELDRWGDEIPITKKPPVIPKIWQINKWSNYNSWEAELFRYTKQVEDIINYTDTSSSFLNMREELKIKINEQLNQHEIILLRYIQNSKRIAEEKIYIHGLIRKTFDNLYEKLDLPYHNSSEIQYKIALNNPEDSSYSLFLNESKQNTPDFISSSINVGNSKLKAKSINEDGQIVEFTPPVNLKNNQIVYLEYTPQNLAKNVNWQVPGTLETQPGVSEFSINNFTSDNVGGYMLQIPDWEPMQQYIISFEYNTHGNDFLLKIVENVGNKDLKSYDLEKNLNSLDWKKAQSIVTAHDESTSAILQILGNSESKHSQMDIRNLSIIKVVYPKLFFKKTNNPIIRKDFPSVKFTKINPTKYIINVSGANNTYLLSFLEEYNSNWKLYNIQKNSSGIGAFSMRILGAVFRDITKFFIKDSKISSGITASYLENKAQEGNHKNIFLDSKTFETWGKMEVANDTHYESNGYANTWLIDPRDMDNKSNYTLILERSTQKNFYLFLPVSITTFLAVLGYFLVSIKKYIKR